MTFNLRKPVEVELEPDLVKKSVDFCKKLQEDKQANKVTDLMFDKKNDSFNINLLGHLGEVAVGKVLNVPIDYEIRTHGDAGWDTVIEGRTVQIKTSNLPSLIFNSPRVFKAQIAVLVQFLGEDRQNADKDPRFKVWGWCTREEFMKMHYKQDYGYGAVSYTHLTLPTKA